MREQLADFGPSINPRPAVFFDKLAFRTARRLTDKQQQYLRENAQSVDVRNGRPIRNSSDDKLLVTIVNPNQRAVEFLAERPKLKINYAEVALDISVPDQGTARYLHQLFDRSFVQRWHGKQQQVRVGDTTYSGQRGANLVYVWYADKVSKRTGEPCFHIEGRHSGPESLRRIGIADPADLPNFDHVAYWRAAMKLYELDLESLGRWHQNRLESRKRQRSIVRQYGPLTYNSDKARGGVLFRVLGEHERQEYRSTQRLVDQYGRGPFLRPIDVSPLLPMPASSFDLYPRHPQVS